VEHRGDGRRRVTDAARREGKPCRCRLVARPIGGAITESQHSGRTGIIIGGGSGG
jgi:hypothetical protein